MKDGLFPILTLALCLGFADNSAGAGEELLKTNAEAP